MNSIWTGKHTARHDALATAVRVKIGLDFLSRVGELSPAGVQKRERMHQEIEKWAGTDDVYALGIMAPCYAMGE